MHHQNESIARAARITLFQSVPYTQTARREQASSLAANAAKFASRDVIVELHRFATLAIASQSGSDTKAGS
jgi:hypothetical protein